MKYQLIVQRNIIGAIQNINSTSWKNRIGAAGLVKTKLLCTTYKNNLWGKPYIISFSQHIKPVKIMSDGADHIKIVYTFPCVNPRETIRG